MRTWLTGLVMTVGCFVALPSCSPHLVAPEPEQMTERLNDLRWSHRVLVVRARGSTVGTIVTSLEARAEPVGDRDLVWFVLTGNATRTNLPAPVSGKLRTDLDALFESTDGVSGDVILIGKDGGVKLRAAALDLDAVFTLIDGMPMRQRERAERGR